MQRRSNRNQAPQSKWIRSAAIVGVLALPLCILVCVVLSMPGTAGAGERAAKNGPTGNQQQARIELGRRLFFEPMASPSGKRSCASCHDPEHGFSDPKRVSVDDFGMTRRHSQAILDTAHNPSSHWDGEFKNVEELVEARLTATPLTGGYGRGGPTPPLTPSSVMSAEDKESLKAQRRAMRDMMKAAFKEMRKQSGAADVAMSEVAKVFGGKHFFLGSGATDKEAVAKKLAAGGRYAEAFQKAFGSEKIELARIGKALDAYCKSIVSTEAPIDRHRAGDGEALSASARRGLALFEGRAGCAECHVSNDEHARFTDYEFHNTGVAWDDLEKGNFGGDHAGFAAMLKNPILKKKLGEQMEKLGLNGKNPLVSALSDSGRHRVSKSKGDARSFKTPTLRDVAKRGPYMHNGRFETLEEVVRYYAKGCGNDEAKDPRLKGFEASDQDVADLVAFLESLTGDERPGLAKHAWSRRAGATRLRFVDHEGKPLAGMLVGLQPTGDAVPTSRKGAPGREIETDERGWIRYVPPPTTHVRLVLSEGLVPTGGDFVPDTCGKATVTLPVKGRMKLVLIFAEGQESPGIVEVRHTPQGVNMVNGSITFTKRNFDIEGKSDGSEPSQKARILTMQDLLAAPVEPTRFLRTSIKTVEGRQIATYEGWVRSDVSEKATLVVPGSGDQDFGAQDMGTQGKDLYSRPIVLEEGSVSKLALAK